MTAGGEMVRWVKRLLGLIFSTHVKSKKHKQTKKQIKDDTQIGVKACNSSIGEAEIGEAQ